MLVKGFTEGFHIPVPDTVQAIQSENHSSSDEQSDLIIQDLKSELSYGRIEGPFDHPPMQNFLCVAHWNDTKEGKWTVP